LALLLGPLGGLLLGGLLLGGLLLGGLLLGGLLLGGLLLGGLLLGGLLLGDLLLGLLLGSFLFLGHNHSSIKGSGRFYLLATIVVTEFKPPLKKSAVLPGQHSKLSIPERSKLPFV
jgi:hypothetical protein